MTVIVHRLKHQYYPSPLAIAKKPSPPPQNNGDANAVAVGYDGEASTVEYFVDADFDDKHGDGDDSVDNHRRRRRRPRHYHRRRDHRPRASQTISIANLAIILRLHHPQRSAKREHGAVHVRPFCASGVQNQKTSCGSKRSFFPSRIPTFLS